MTNSTEPERRATFADLRAGMLARIPRPTPNLFGPNADPDTEALHAAPLVYVLGEPHPCRARCGALVVAYQLLEPDTTDRMNKAAARTIRYAHRLPARPVLIVEEL